MIAHDWLLWQLADSAFPSGGFAHSGGLEAAWQHGQVVAGESLVRFFAVALQQTAMGVATFTLAVHHDPDRFAELDIDCGLYLNNHVANRASRAQGQAMLAAAERIFDIEVLTAFHEEARRRKSAMHLALVLGVIGRTLGLDALQTIRLLLFGSLRGMISAAVRLGIVGPMEGQSIQNRLGVFAESLTQRCLTCAADAAQTAPLLDLMQSTQDRLYSRLFQT